MCVDMASKTQATLSTCTLSRLGCVCAQGLAPCNRATCVLGVFKVGQDPNCHPGVASTACRCYTCWLLCKHGFALSASNPSRRATSLVLADTLSAPLLSPYARNAIFALLFMQLLSNHASRPTSLYIIGTQPHERGICTHVLYPS